MPRALAIETSGRIGSVALSDAGVIRSEESFPYGLAHAAQLLPMIDRHVRAAGWQPKDIEHLYLSIGPGSFTGLRIAVTLAKTLALATGVKLVAVPSVRVLAETAPAEARHLIIVLDAKRGQIFTARFERAETHETSRDRKGAEAPAIENWIEREPAHLDTLAAMVGRSPRPVHLIGEGIPYHRDEIPADVDVIVTPEDSWRGRAGAVARLGAAMAAREEFSDPWTLIPTYIRLPEAEEKWRLANPSTEHA